MSLSQDLIYFHGYFKIAFQEGVASLLAKVIRDQKAMSQTRSKLLNRFSWSLKILNSHLLLNWSGVQVIDYLYTTLSIPQALQHMCRQVIKSNTSFEEVMDLSSKGFIVE